MITSDVLRRTLATVALTASILCIGSSAADAGLGIIIVETDLQPVGDPLTEFSFRLALLPQNSLLLGDNITLLNVPNFGGNARFVSSSTGPDLSQFFSISSAANLDGTTRITLAWNSAVLSLVNNGTSNLEFGDLKVETTVEFAPEPGSPLFDPIYYTTQTHIPGGLNLGSGVTVAQSPVPEPSSLTLLGVGTASGLLLLRQRRRRTCPA